MRILINSPLGQKYGYSKGASAAAQGKMADIIGMIDTRLEAQAQRGSSYLVADAHTAVDICWANLSMSVLPPPAEIMLVIRHNRRMLRCFEPILRYQTLPERSQTGSRLIRDSL